MVRSEQVTMVGGSETDRNKMDWGVQRIREDLLRFPLADPAVTAAGYATQGYGVVCSGKAIVLVDVVAEPHLPALQALADQGLRPAALVLTHRHLLGLGGAHAQIAEALGVPMFLHPADADHPTVREAGGRFEDPMRSALLDGLGVTVTCFPGHTPGHVMLRWEARGGTLIAGDCAVGPTLEEHRRGALGLIRPPPAASDDDALLRQGWREYKGKPVCCMLCLHGEPILKEAAEIAALMEPLRRPELTPEFRVH